MDLTISAQPATENRERRAALFNCFRDGSLLLEARDFQKPAKFILTAKDSFPWDDFLKKLLMAWQMGDFADIPEAFRPLKRIPPFIIEGFDLETLPNRLKICAALRSQGYFPALPEKVR